MGVRLFTTNYLDPDLVTVSASSEATGFPASNLYNSPRRSKVWRSTGVSGEWLKWDLGATTNPKAFFLIGPRSRPIRITASATITLQGNETDAWTAPSYEKILTPDDKLISAVSETGLHTEGLRYWRLLIDDPLNPYGYVEAGAVMLGDWFSPTRGAVQFPFLGSYVDYSTTVFSEGGHSFSDIKAKTEEFVIKWAGLTYAEKEVLDTHFDAVGKSHAFFVQFDPTGAFSSGNHYYTRYLKFSDEPSYRLVTPNNFEMDMRLREEL